MKTQILLLAAALLLASCSPAAKVSTNGKPSVPVAPASGFSFKEDHITGFHKPLVIAGYGASGIDLLNELKKGNGYWKLALFLDGVEIPGLPASYEVPAIIAEFLAADAEVKAASQNPPAETDKSTEAEAKRTRAATAKERLAVAQTAKNGAGSLPVVEVTFILQRDSEQVKNREAWDAFFSAKKMTDPQTHVSFSFAGGHPVALVPPLHFSVADEWRLKWSWIIGLAISAGLLFGARFCSDMLRDNGQPGGVFSLGRTQMAVWGSVVVGAWVGVAILCGCMEHIPAQTLVLLGISATTGLGSVMVGTANSPVTQNVPTRGFFRDLITGDQGASFQRLQVIVWTIALASFFIWNVFQTLSMPVFTDTLLVLMGISNGTYLGFKMQEGRLTVDNWKAETGQLTVSISGGTLPYSVQLTGNDTPATVIKSASPITSFGEVKLPLAPALTAGQDVILTVYDADGHQVKATGKVV